MKPRVLILAFSEVQSDARVLRQVRALAPLADVTTCGFGPQPHPDVRHIRIDARVASRAREYQEAILRRSRCYSALYWSDPHVRSARATLRSLTFDAVIANDLDTLPLALSIAGGERVHADLHEFFPGLHNDVPAWVRLRKPYYEWLLRRFATRAASVTTVAQGVADAYRTWYSLECGVVTNAGPQADLAPTTVEPLIRLVHSGVAQPGRKLELTMRAAARSTSNVSLDLYLMPSDRAYLSTLTALADALGDRVRVREPLPHDELVIELNRYDVGVFLLPPTTMNNALALPNKLFDFVQARLGVVIGPSPEMSRLVGEHGFGAVTRDFTEDSLVGALDSLTPELVTAWKRAADRAAGTLSSDHQVNGWIAPVRAAWNRSRAAAR